MDTYLADTTYVAALPQFDSIGNLILSGLGVIVFVLLATRITVAYAKEQWGKMVTEVFAAIFALWFVLFPDNAKETIKTIIKSIF